MKEYRYSVKIKIEHTVRSIVLLCILGGILFFIGTFGYLKYIVWIPFLWIADILGSSVWYLCKAIYCVDMAGFNIRNVPNSKVIPWDEIQNVRVIKYGSEIIKLDIFVKGQGRLTTLDKDIVNHKELFETIMANTKGKLEEKKKIFFIDK